MRAAWTLPITLALACANTPASGPDPAAPNASAPAQAPTPNGDARFDPPYQPVPPDVADPPRYKPSGSSPSPVPTTTNAYGAFKAAPSAPRLGDTAADFQVALAGGGTFALADARAAGPVLLMFYRGFW